MAEAKPSLTELEQLDLESQVLAKQIEVQKQKNILREVTNDKGEGTRLLCGIFQIIENPMLLILFIIGLVVGMYIGHSLP